MKCENFKNKMYEFHEDDLDAEQKIAMKKHLESCNLCSNEFDNMYNVFDTLSDLDLLCPPSDFTQNVMDAIGIMSTKAVSWKKKAYRLWGSSLVAAGILISIVNLSFADSNIEKQVLSNIVTKKYEISKTINHGIKKVYNVIDDIIDIIDY